MSPIWVAPIEVIEALAKRYRLSGRYADFNVCVTAAEDTVMARLVAGHLPSIASYVHYCAAACFPCEIRDQAVPKTFWRDWNAARLNERESDWFVGDFRYEHGIESTSDECWGNAFEVRIDATAFPTLELSCLSEISHSGEMNSGKGRKPANWWPDFAEELAVYLYLNGLPETQAALLDGVQAAMSEAGKEEPSRTTIQPIIRNVFRRIRGRVRQGGVISAVAVGHRQAALAVMCRG